MQLQEAIRDQIENGSLRAGQRISSERELGQVYGLSRTTVREALDALVSCGLLRTVPGKGTFVAQDKTTYEALTLAGFREQALLAGHLPTTLLLRLEKVLAPEGMAPQLAIEPDAPVFLLERLRKVNDLPMALHVSYIPCALCPGLSEQQLNDRPLYRVLESEYGLVVGHAHETLESTTARPREALLLDIPVGAPVILLRILLYLQDGRPLEYVKGIYRGDRVKLRIEM